MGDLFDPTALEGLRYLDLLRTQPIRPSVDAFEGYLDHPRPERKSLTDALKASKSPTGADILAWMSSVGWVELSESADANGVGITDLGSAILSIVDRRDSATGDHTEVPNSAEEPGTELPLIELVESGIDLPAEDGTRAGGKSGLPAVAWG
jgi:hypothetical protein